MKNVLTAFKCVKLSNCIHSALDFCHEPRLAHSLAERSIPISEVLGSNQVISKSLHRTRVTVNRWNGDIRDREWPIKNIVTEISLQISRLIPGFRFFVKKSGIHLLNVNFWRLHTRHDTRQSIFLGKVKKFSLQKVFVAKVLFESGGLPRGQLCNNLDNLRSDSDSSGGKS